MTTPKSYMTDAEREELRREGATENLIFLVESQEADKAGDDDASWAWLARARLPAYTLRYLKRRRGAEFIRNLGFNTVEADAVYGSGWLERQEA